VSAAAPSAAEPLVVGRYALFDELASGGMATVHLGRLLGPEGFGRTVAIKRLRAHFIADEEFVTMFMDEARVAARIQHPNVVPMIDVVHHPSQGLFLVMDYIHGESLSRLVRGARARGETLPVRVAVGVVYGALMGLNAAHETRGVDGELLGVVHRDVSPQNVIVGADGVPRVLDFGIAKAAGRAQVTREGQIKGKLAYMAPEQVRGQVDRRTDLFSVSVCLWEALAGRRMHEGLKDVDIITRVMRGKFVAPSTQNPEVTPALDEIVLRGLSPDPTKRFATAKEMAIELERAVGIATPSEISEVVERLGHDALQARARRIDAVERASADLGEGEALEVTAPPEPEPAPARAAPDLDVEIEMTPIALHGAPVSQTTGGAAFTAADEAAAPADDERILTAPWIVLMCVSAVLALSGALMTSSALAHKRAADHAAASSSASAPVPPARAALPATSSESAPSSRGPSGAPSSRAPAAPGVPVGSSGAAAGPDAQADAGASEGPEGSPSSSSSSSSSMDAVADAGAGAGAGGAAGATSGSACPDAAAPKTTAAARPAPWSPPPRPAPKRPACDPPYSTDEAGHRHYKPECFADTL
jgi:serine/threonine-protein kinase